MKSYIAILSSLVVALTPIPATAQETETQDQRGITVAKKTSAAMPVTGTPKLVPQLGHSQQVVKGALSPDGRYALTGAGGDDSAAILWDATRQSVKTIRNRIFPILGTSRLYRTESECWLHRPNRYFYMTLMAVPRSLVSS